MTDLCMLILRVLMSVFWPVGFRGFYLSTLRTPLGLIQERTL